MPYENMMPYIPMAQPQSALSLRERAGRNRDKWEQDELAKNASYYDDPGMRMRADMNTAHQRMQSDTFASSNPSWDSWFQALNEGTGGKQGSGIIGGGREARAQERELAMGSLQGQDDAAGLSGYNVTGRSRTQGARPSLSALKGIGYLKG